MNRDIFVCSKRGEKGLILSQYNWRLNICTFKMERSEEKRD